jgi:hypothetical protein
VKGLKKILPKQAKRKEMKKLIIRLRVCYNILFRKYNHWAILNLDKDNLVKLLQDKEFEADILYHGLQPYVCNRMIQMVANNFNDIDSICAKAEFEAEALEYQKRKTPNP